MSVEISIRTAQVLMEKIQEGMLQADFITVINEAHKHLNAAIDELNKPPEAVDYPGDALNRSFCYTLPGDAEKVSQRFDVFGTEAAIDRLGVLLKHSTMTMQIGEANCNLFVQGNFASIGQLSSILGQNEEQRRKINEMKSELERSRNRTVIDACQKANRLCEDLMIQEMDTLVRWQSELQYGGEKLEIVHSDKFADGVFYVRHSFGDEEFSEHAYPAYTHLGALLLAKNADLNYAVPLEWFI